VPKLGQKPCFIEPAKRNGMRPPVILILLVVIVIGALIFFSTRAREVPTTTIETDVIPVANAG
jgi:hypothetical protein